MDDDMDDFNDDIVEIATPSMDTPTAIKLVNKQFENEAKQSMITDKDNKLHPIWNLYDWYHSETTMQVIDDILSGDVEDFSIDEFFNSLRQKHGYIHEALVNNEWNIWKFVQECKEIDNYHEALLKLLDEHPRVYAAIHGEQILFELSQLYDDDDDDDNDYYDDDEIDEEYKTDHDVESQGDTLEAVEEGDEDEDEEEDDEDEEEIYNKIELRNKALTFIDVDYGGKYGRYGNEDNKESINDFISHPEFQLHLLVIIMVKLSCGK